MEWLLLVIAGIFLIGALWGFYRGAIRIAVSLVTTLVTFVIVLFATPYVSDLVIRYTPFEDMIESSVSNTITGAISGVVEDAADDALGGEAENLTDAQVQEALEAAGISGEDADLSKELQSEAINEADLPEVFKSLLSQNNNSDTYAQLGVESFAQYVGTFLADIIINAVTFLALFLLVTILLRAVVFALDIVTNLPVLGAVNRIAGAVVGLIFALIIVWILYIIITLLYTTSFGKEMYDTIMGNGITKFLYDVNPIIGLVLK